MLSNRTATRLAARLRPRHMSLSPADAPQTSSLAVIKGVSLAGKPFVDELRINAGEHWLVAGPAGSGKSLLAGLLAGLRGPLDPVRYAASPDAPTEGNKGTLYLDPRLSTRLLDFREESDAFSYAGHYLQERFESLSLDGDNLVRRGGRGELDLFGFLLTALDGPPGSPEPTAEEAARRDAAALAMMDRVALPRSKAGLLFMKLSNGQSRRARIGRMLLQLEEGASPAVRREAAPSLLLLDEPYVGLDRWSRVRVGDLVRDLASRTADLGVAMFTRDPRGPAVDGEGPVPEWITHVAELHPSPHPHLAWSGPRAEFEKRLTAKASSVHRSAAVPIPATSPAEPYISLRGIRIAYPSKAGTTAPPVVSNLTWHLARGEKWALLGPNGSGKSTLLSLLTADHPQSYSNDVVLFGRPRKGMSIWEVKKRVGYTSPELLLYLPNLLGRRAVGEGATLGDVFRSAWERDPTDPPPASARPAVDAEIDLIARPFAVRGLLPPNSTPFARLSTTQQRLALFLRSFMGSPDLVVLDEPWQGMDASAVALCRGWVDWWAGIEGAAQGEGLPEGLRGKGRDVAVIFTTHDWERELPACVTKLCWLKMVETPEGEEVNDGCTLEEITSAR
ncbi:P-loop containing nucleoside triphosphate hydrolase protein [Hyaloraphidium curvatum]|nr:P-loop containing nucleoside triphosphate hydrolase protein [Hyaloraphidium curvatum]